MKKNIILIWLFCFITTHNLFAQEANNGYFTSEAETTVLGTNIIVSIKKYNPTGDQIKNAGSPGKDQPMTYLQLPFQTTKAELFDKGFESMLFCFDKEGSLLWNNSLGYSKSSLPSPVTEFDGYVFTGECEKENDRVTIQKIDKAGKLIWSTKLDSLETLHSIYVFNNKVNAVVSFMHSERVDDPKTKTFHFKTFPIYFFTQIDPETGKVLKKEYQMMGSYLSSVGFGNPVINSDYSFLMNNKDSVVFLPIFDQKKATVVSEKLSDRGNVLAVAADSGSIHYLVFDVDGKKKPTLSLFSDYYDVNSKKYQSPLPTENPFHQFHHVTICKTDSDTLLTATNDEKSIYLFYTDRNGKSSLHKKFDNTSRLLPLATSIIGGIPYIITVEGRTKPGQTGKIKILF